MTIELKVYDNGDHTCLVWLPANAQAIPNCRGFTIHRTLKPAASGAARTNLDAIDMTRIPLVEVRQAVFVQSERSDEPDAIVSPLACREKVRDKPEVSATGTCYRM